MDTSKMEVAAEEQPLTVIPVFEHRLRLWDDFKPMIMMSDPLFLSYYSPVIRIRQVDSGYQGAYS